MGVDEPDTVVVAMLVPMSDSKGVTPDSCGGSDVYYDGNGTSYPRCSFMDNSFFALAMLGLTSAEEFNARSGRYIKEFADLGDCNKKLDIRLYDSSYNPPVTTRVVLDMLLKDKVTPVAAIGAATSSETMPVSLILGANGIPMIGYWATSPRLDDTVQYPYYMRTILGDNIIAVMTCRLWQDYGYQFVGMLFQNDWYGHGFKELIINSCAKVGISVSAMPFTSLEQISKLAALKVNIFLLVSAGEEFKTIISEAHRIGIVGPGKQWYFSDGVGPQLIRELPKEIADAVSGSSQIIQVGGVDGNLAFDRLKKDWNTFSHSKFAPYFPDHWKPPSTFFNDSSVFFNPYFSEGGAYMFDAVASLAISLCKVAPIGPIPRPFDKHMFATKDTIRFQGMSGEVAFDEIGNRNLNTAKFQIFNLVSYTDPTGSIQSASVQVGTYNTTLNHWTFFREHISNGNFTGTVLDIEPATHDMQHAGSTKTICLAMFAVGIAFDFVLFCWLYLYRKNSIVRASQRNFLTLVALGSGVSLCSIPLMAADDEFYSADQYNYTTTVALNSVPSLDRACYFSVFCFSFGISLSHTSLAVKAYKVKAIFNSQGFRFIKVPSYVLFSYIFFVSFVDVSILALWGITTPTQFQRVVEERDVNGFPVLSAGRCDYSDSNGFIYTLIMLHFVLLFFGSYFAFETRGVHTAFAEGKYVGLSIVLTMQLLALAAPVNVIASQSTVLTLFFRSLIVFFSNFIVLCLVFIPKIYLSMTAIGKTNLRGLVNGSSNPTTTSNSQRKYSVVKPSTFHTSEALASSS